jgi:hypothetical protein
VRNLANRQPANCPTCGRQLVVTFTDDTAKALWKIEDLASFTLWYETDSGWKEYDYFGGILCLFCREEYQSDDVKAFYESVVHAIYQEEGRVLNARNGNG